MNDAIHCAHQSDHPTHHTGRPLICQRNRQAADLPQRAIVGLQLWTARQHAQQQSRGAMSIDRMKDDLAKAIPPSALMKTCKRCHEQFHPDANARSCRFHPEYYSGETAQRWLPPGANKGQGAKVVMHWWCCGAEDPNALGCATTTHTGYDD